ncbi:MAG: hypothetical protein Q9168_007143 [Polycauliona sp. 1 TL-2023]
MANEEPVILHLFLDLDKEFQRQEEIRKRRPPKRRKPPLSRLDVLPPCHREHYRDWIMVNGTCQRLRRVGKPAFFREKLFAIAKWVLEHLAVDKVKNMTASDLVLAKTCVRHLVIPYRDQHCTEQEFLDNGFFERVQSVGRVVHRSETIGPGHARMWTDVETVWGSR